MDRRLAAAPSPTGPRNPAVRRDHAGADGRRTAGQPKGAKGYDELMKSFFSTQEREADRCHSLVDTVPAEPPPDAFNRPSKAYKPKWLDEDLGFTLDNDWGSEADLETEEVILGL